MWRSERRGGKYSRGDDDNDNDNGGDNDNDDDNDGGGDGGEDCESVVTIQWIGIFRVS